MPLETLARAEHATVAERVRSALAAEADHQSSATALRERICELVRAEAPLLTGSAMTALVAEVQADLQGMGPLDALLADDGVSDVMVNGDGSVWVERHGRIERTPLSLSGRDVRNLIDRVVAPLGLRIDRSSPVVDARLPDGSRLHAVIPPLAVDGPTLTIRRFAVRPVPLHEFAEPALEMDLTAAVRERRSIIVCGGTGSGKTTLLNALAGLIPTEERIVTIEDSAELRLPTPHIVRLEARPANAEGVGAVTIRDLVRAALRMRPDRIIVGEVRGGETLDMVQAMSTGHAGSMSTCHARTPVEALRRLEAMAMMSDVAVPLDVVQRQMASAIDLIVQVQRGEGGARRVAAVSRIVDGRRGPQCVAFYERGAS